MGGGGTRGQYGRLGRLGSSVFAPTGMSVCLEQSA